MDKNILMEKDKHLYDAFVDLSPQGSLFHKSWWLDTVAPAKYKVFIVKDNNGILAAWPMVFQQILGLKLCILPQLTPTLGIMFGPYRKQKYAEQLSEEIRLTNELIKIMPKQVFFFQHFHHEFSNWLPLYWAGFLQTTRYTYIIEDLSNLDRVWENIRYSTKRKIKKAMKLGIKVVTDMGLDRLLDLNELTFRRQGLPLPYSREYVKKIDEACKKRGARKMFFAVDSNGRLHAAVYIVYDHKAAYYLFGGGDPNLRHSNGHALVLWEAVKFASTVSRSFDFEGSMHKNIEPVFRGFGAVQKQKNPDKTINGKPELGYICSILFFVCYSASILVLYFYPVRSIEYYLLVTIMGMCILGQILFAPDALFYGMYSIPRSAVFFLEMLLIYLLLQKKDTITVAVTIFSAFAIVMYHPASIPFVLLILVLVYFLQRFYKIERETYLVTLNYLFLVVVMTLTYWLYYGQAMFRAIIKNLLTEGPSGVLTKSIFDSPLNELFNYLQFSPLLFFIICGVLYILTSEKLAKTNKLFYISALCLAFVTFPGPALLINKIARNFNFVRFGEYSFFFICLAGATGLYVLLMKLKTSHRAGAVILFALMAFLSVSNDFTASDNPLIKRPFYTYYFTKSETTAMDRLSSLAKGYVMADYPSTRYLKYSDYPYKGHILEVSALKQEILTNSSDDIVLIRKEELKKRPLKLYTSPDGKFRFDPSIEASQDYYDGSAPLWDTLEEFNSVYDSGSVNGVYRTERVNLDESDL